jgi:hypothetical protein
MVVSWTTQRRGSTTKPLAGTPSSILRMTERGDPWLASSGKDALAHRKRKRQAALADPALARISQKGP